MAPLPLGCPDVVPPETLKDTVAIVTIHHPGTAVLKINPSTRFLKIKTNATGGATDIAGWHIVLPRFPEQSYYRFGRYMENNKTPKPDVYLPGFTAKMQFTLIPDPSIDCWRYQSNTETFATVNDIPIQNYTFRTKTYVTQYPHAVYLNQSQPNHVDIHGLQLTIWLLKSAREVHGTGPNKMLVPLVLAVQDVSKRSEAWAKARYFIAPNVEKVSRKSFRLVERFTGTRATAKMFGTEEHAASRRDAEFLRMNKVTVDDSIVRYLQSTGINGDLSIITSTHEGFTPLETCYGKIRTWHPSLRCRVASTLLRQLFSALDYLHFNGTLHRYVTERSVLMRFAGRELDRILLVDYSHTSSMSRGEEPPRDRIVEDARCAIFLVDRCCDLWNLRKGPSSSRRPEPEMQTLRDYATEELVKIQRFISQAKKQDEHFLESPKGKEYVKLLNKKQQALVFAKTEQEHNRSRLQMHPVTSGMTQEIIRKWPRPQFATDKIDEAHVILTLGHRYLDDLVNEFHQESFDNTPREVCARLKAMEGECKNPWQTFTVSKTFSFPVTLIGTENRCTFTRQSLAIYLAHCIQLYPNLHSEIITLHNAFLQRSTGPANTHHLAAFSTSLKAQTRVPSNMRATLERLIATRKSENLPIEETYSIWWHVPSRMFNVTQLHRLAAPFVLRDCIRFDMVPCSNFAEVRGDPVLQGCFVSLDLLPYFLQVLRIDVVEAPAPQKMLPTYDPSDFSDTVHEGRIILARTGLVAYASVCRTANQLTHCPQHPDDIYGVEEFLPTLFGDMDVLPPKPDGRFNYPRPTHWSKFVAAEASVRKILAPQRPSAARAAQSVVKRRNLLQELLNEYKDVLVDAEPPPKRTVPGSFSFGSLGPSTPKRFRRERSPDSNGSYSPPYPTQRVAHSRRKDPGEIAASARPIDPNQSITVVDGSFNGFIKDQQDVDRMLAEMTDASGEPSNATETEPRLGATLESLAISTTSTIPPHWSKAGVDVMDSVMKEPKNTDGDTPMTTAVQKNDVDSEDDDSDSDMADTVIVEWAKEEQGA
ncbi:hypothetical protein K491DRAFT_226202 [Lophiostoma macrostomum CBS 122681]|uniref:Protein kinase domain-containing protein n=1 Tax=Lophiostoma macrostomum CBS 122681 TaxID=1314788 RepID=A0A6A6TGD0_9PLEO|nr:hypothetical protein K491DRAFT_226202 [Lophiostoma macrostomum CBS 122681]